MILVISISISFTIVRALLQDDGPAAGAADPELPLLCAAAVPLDPDPATQDAYFILCYITLHHYVYVYIYIYMYICICIEREI